MGPHLHFVGIGGIGMSGLAEVFFRQGLKVTGSDLSESETTRKLIRLGIEVKFGHRPENVHGATLVVISSAVKESNPERVEAKRLRIPVIPRAEMLGELMRGRTGIAIAGSHGKTTTTSMMSTLFHHVGQDPTIVIGGRVDALGGNARLGKGQLVIAEADESDGTFSFLPAVYAVLTNIDNDHLDYYVTQETLDEAFISFVNKLPFHGLAAVCLEDAGVRRCLPEFRKPFVTYGFSVDSDLFAADIDFTETGSEFTVYTRVDPTGAKKEEHDPLGRFRLNVHGRHNVLNALACIAIARRMGLDTQLISKGLAEFVGVQRRFQTVYSDKKLRVIDDYGHHPTEIRATLETARALWPGRVIAVFQPHRYSRTKLCYPEFLNAFHSSDLLLLMDIYAAGEDPIDEIHSSKLAQDLNQGRGDFAHWTGALENTHAKILEIAQEGDLILCMGAGSITRLAFELAKALQERERSR